MNRDEILKEANKKIEIEQNGIITDKISCLITQKEQLIFKIKKIDEQIEEITGDPKKYILEEKEKINKVTLSNGFISYS